MGAGAGAGAGAEGAGVEVGAGAGIGVGVGVRRRRSSGCSGTARHRKSQEPGAVGAICRGRDFFEQLRMKQPAEEESDARLPCRGIAILLARDGLVHGKSRECAAW